MSLLLKKMSKCPWNPWKTEIDILINSIHVESVILKEPIDDSKTDVIVEAQDENK